MSNNDNTVQKNNIKNEKEKVTNIWIWELVLIFPLSILSIHDTWFVVLYKLYVSIIYENISTKEALKTIAHKHKVKEV